jgi:hypothetical protein
MNRSNPALPLRALALLTLAALSACSSADSATTSSGAGGAGPTTTTDAIAPLTSCLDDDIKDGFAGPGYDATMGGLQAPVQATYVASTTVLLQSTTDAAKQMLFGQLVPPIITDVQKAPGFIGFQLGLSSKCHYARTLTVWKDMDSMMAFVMSPNHVNAMSHASQASDAGAVTNWEIAAADFPPTWDMARQEILKMGMPAY